MCEDFTPNFTDKRTGCCIMTTRHLTSPFHQRIFDQKQHDSHPSPILLFSVSPIEDKIERPPFETIKVIMAESQVVAKALTEHDFQDAFKNARSSGNGAYARKAKVMVASRPTVSF
jgi:hypothetical protein